MFYYSPILFSRICDIHLSQFSDCQYNIDELNKKDQIIIYAVQSVHFLSKLDVFLEKVCKPFILITAMEDTEFPREIDAGLYNKIVSHSYFKHWFAINKTCDNNSKMTSLPYGLDFWTLTTRPYFGENIQDIESQNQLLRNISESAPKWLGRIPKIYANFHFNVSERYGGWRSRLYDIIPSEIIDFEKDRISRSESWNKISEYVFIVSPFGNGLDCIRTFEALCLGCIVIMQKSCLDSIYEGLPVIFVDEWTDINAGLLESKLIEFSTKEFNYEKLNMDYWVSIVNSKWT